MELNEHFVKTKIHKNCRDFFKRMYDLPCTIGNDFVHELEQFGRLEINEFSKVVATAKDSFTIFGKDGLEIRGVVDDNSILLVVPKNNPEEYERFEALLENYIKEKKGSK